MRPPRHIHRIEIKEHHLDSFNHVNNAVYLQLFEQARWDLITGNGYGPEKIKETNLGPVILEVTVKFRKEITGGDTIRIETWSLKMEGDRFIRIEQEMFNSRDQLACVASFKIGIMDLAKRQLVKAPPEWALAVGVKSPT